MSEVSRERFADVVRAGGAAGDPADVRLDLALLLLSVEARPDDVASDSELDSLVQHGLDHNWVRLVKSMFLKCFLV